MKISMSLVLAMAAGAAATSATFAQVQPVNKASAKKAVKAPAFQDQVITTAVEAPLPLNYVPQFGNRANALVYSTGLPTETGGDWRGNGGAGFNQAADDVSFTPGLGAGGNFFMNGIAFGWVTAATPAITDTAATATFNFHDTYVAAGNPPFSGTVVSTFAFNLATTTLGNIIQFYAAPLTIPAAAQYQQLDDNIVVEQTMSHTVSGLPHNNIQPAIRGLIPNEEVGSSDPIRYNRNQAAAGAWAGFGAAGNARNVYLKLQGDVTIPTPTCTSVPAITDAGAILNVPASGNVQWFCVTINGDATDDAGPTFDGQFFDLDTEGSAQDLSIGLYDSAGNRVGVDADGGSGTNAQLSYGMGRRAAVGDGEQYDGRHGELLAGTYYLAVAPAGATFAGGAYGVNSATPLAGANQVRFFTNTGGSPLAASVPPVATHLGVVDGSAQVTTGPAQPAAQRVAWFSFETCVDAADPTSYLDIDSFGSNEIADGEVFIFDSVGNLVATDDDNGAGFLPQLSFGQIAPSRPPFGTGLPFEGQNGTLPAGFYYMGIGLFDTVAKINNPSTDGRWHLRNTSLSSLPQQFTFTPSWTECPAGSCPWSQGGCIADYNGSGGTPDDADVAAFFDAWNAGDECSDANGSGGTPDDADVAMFFDLWNQGGC
ncbi:MAG: hypothetical protein HUU18_10100 [Phycisphaerales bacterium]|nr:hypothetical protein [Phycisphaerales bacterium]